MLEKRGTVLKTGKKFYSPGALNSLPQRSFLHLDPLQGNFLIENYLFALADPAQYAEVVNEK